MPLTAGVRVGQSVLPQLRRGWSAEELGWQYPHLTMADVHAALDCYLNRTEEITREIEAERAEEYGCARKRRPVIS